MNPTEANNPLSLQEQLRDFVAYTLTSAKGLYREPQNYGPMRMIDSLELALRILREAGIIDEEIEESMDTIRKERWRAMNDPEGFAKAIDTAILNLVRVTVK